MKDWFLVYSPWNIFSICIGYIVLCYIGPKLMANRKPFELRAVLVVYNLFMVLLSMYMFKEVSCIYINISLSSVDGRQYRICLACTFKLFSPHLCTHNIIVCWVCVNVCIYDNVCIIYQFKCLLTSFYACTTSDYLHSCFFPQELSI